MYEKQTTVVILHGWGLSGDRFAPLARELTSVGYSPIYLDLPGFGKSDMPPRPLFLIDYVHFLHEFLLKKKKTLSLVLLGHSFGGRVALLYTKVYPHDVKALILTGVPGYTPVARKKLMFFILLAKFGKTVLSLPFLSAFQDKVRRWYYYVVGAREFYRAEGPMRETFKNIVSEELETPMRAVSVPCNLIWGQNDTIVPVAIAEKMKRTIKGATLTVLAQADHGVPFKSPELFARTVHSFLSKL